jgi:hypothetical protein
MENIELPITKSPFFLLDQTPFSLETWPPIGGPIFSSGHLLVWGTRIPPRGKYALFFTFLGIKLNKYLNKYNLYYEGILKRYY